MKYPHTSRGEMCQFVPTQAGIVLDVGCNTGGFAEALKRNREITVWGVEPEPNAASIARERVDRIITTPFDSSASIPDSYFDAVIFNDVLEHLVNPWDALKLAATKLKPGGCVVASIPNLRQIDNLLHIIRDGDFRYEAMGIRDRTHLRFFTKISIRRLFEESGYVVDVLRGINEDWWSPRMARRLLFRILGSRIDDTRYTQFAVVAHPLICRDH